MDYPEPNFPVAELEELKSENPAISYLPGGVTFNDLLAKVDSSDTYAMYHLAFYLHQRFWFETKSQSMVEVAMQYFYKAARCGYSPAMYSLGGIYLKGEGVVADPRRALLYFDQSNEIIAGEEIGRYYMNGDVIPQNYEKAFMCFAKCALLKEKYDYSALPELAKMYREGIFVEMDGRFADYLEEQSKKRGESARDINDKG